MMFPFRSGDTMVGDLMRLVSNTAPPVRAPAAERPRSVSASAAPRPEAPPAQQAEDPFCAASIAQVYARRERAVLAEQARVYGGSHASNAADRRLA